MYFTDLLYNDKLYKKIALYVFPDIFRKNHKEELLILD